MSLELQIELLIAFGVLLVIAEAFIPAFGALALIGVIAFGFGTSLMYKNPDLHTALINPATIWGIAAVAVIFTLVAAWFVRKAYKKPITTGQESLVGKDATIAQWTKTDKTVVVQGEIWRAEPQKENTTFTKGDKVEIIRADGLTLIIK